MTPKRIGFIGFDGVVAIDLAGPVEAFNCAEIRGAQNGPRKCYEVVTIGLSNRPFVAESGLVFKPQKTFKNTPPLDTLVIPGGRGLRKPEIGKPIAAFVKARAALPSNRVYLHRPLRPRHDRSFGWPQGDNPLAFRSGVCVSLSGASN